MEGIEDFSLFEFAVSFDDTVFDVADLCKFTEARETDEGLIAAAGVTFTHVAPGEVRFTVDKEVPAGKSYSGIVNAISLMGKKTGRSAVEIVY